MKKNPKKILCFGEVLWDMLPSGPKPGGAPMNVALHLAQFGFEVHLASKVGLDHKGFNLKEFIDKAGLNIDMLQLDTSLPTSEVLITLDEHNNPTYDILEPVAWDNIELTDDLIHLSRKVDLIIYGSLASRNEKTRRTLLSILETEATKIMDINLRPPYDKKEVVEDLMQRSDVIKLNEDELEEVVNNWNNMNIHDEDQQIRWMAKQFNCNLVCVTKGERGAVLYHDGIIDHHPGFKVKTVDNVGAGDAFLAGLISSFLKGHWGVEALEYACATGAYVASRTGATPKYELKEIDAITNQQLP
jgi:fructokinase